MGLAWNNWAIPGLVIPVLVGAMAWAVYRVRPHRAQNRYLACFLFISALGVLSGHGLRLLAADKATAYGVYIPFLVASVIGIGFMLLLLGTLKVPWLASLGRTSGKLVVAAYTAVSTLIIVLRPDLFAKDLRFVPSVHSYIANPAGPLFAPFALSGLAVALLGIPASIVAARRGTSDLERAKAWALARAFIVYDVVALVFYGWAFLVVPNHQGDFSVAEVLFNFYTLDVGTLLFAGFLAYGILRAQLFDFDLKIKWTIKRGTLAGIFVAVFLIVSQIAQNYHSSKGGLLTGGFVTGLVLFAINPLQKVAERISSAAVPGARPDVVDARRLQVYKAALEGALQDGVVTDKERTMLTRLQLELGIANHEAKGMEVTMQAI